MEIIQALTLFTAFRSVIQDYFSPVDKNAVLKKIKGLSDNEAVQDADIPVKALKENANFFY